MLRRRRARSVLSLLVAVLLPTTSAVVLSGSHPGMAEPAANCPRGADDEASALRAATACRGRVEVVAARDEKTQVFANANGTFTAESSAVVQRVRDAGGRWVKPDPTLRRATDGRIAPVATSLRIAFSGGGAGPAVTIGKGSAELGLRWPGALPAPKLSGSNATYSEVLPGVDLVLTAQAEGFAEMLVVKDATAAANPALAAVRFATTTTGLRLRQDAAGALTAVDGSGATLFGSGTPVMWDSTKPAGDGPARVSRAVPGAARSAMPVQFVGGDLVVHPDLSMLRGKATKFPVYIDPALGKSAWTMINSAFPSQSYWSFDKQDCPAPYTSIQCAKVGYTTSPSPMIYRSLFAFGVSGLLHKHIQDAKLSMDTVYSYTNTDYGTQVRVTGGISSGTTWSTNASSWGAVVATANSHAYDRVRRRTEWGVTSAVQTASGGSSGTLTFGLREVSESDVKNWKKFDAGTALLTVIYNSYPNAPDTITAGGQPCVRGASRPYLRTLTPALKARLSDPDGTARLLEGTFYWWNYSGGSRSSANSVAQGSIVSGQYANATMPAGKLADGGTYVVQAIANDGIDNGQYSATCEFQVDVTAPGAPSAVTSTDYPNDGQLHGGVGTAGSFVLKPSATVPADFYGYAYTLDPGISAASATQVAASSTDHTATITLTPASDQTFNLRVWSRDKAGNYSAAYSYQFSVRAGTGPDARWTFDGQNGADDSLHGNTFAVTGGTWSAGRGSYGKAFTGDGTSAYTATTGPVVTNNPSTGTPVTVHSNVSFTVAAIVRLDSAAGSGQRVIVAQDGTRTSPFLLSYSVTDKKWRFAVAATDVDAPTTVAVLSNSTVTTGVWTRLFATYDGTSHGLKLFVNGTLQTATGTSATFDATGPVTVGRGKAAGAATGFFPGAIDDVRLYARAVGSAEHEFTLVGLPNPPIVTFPAGTATYAGKTIQAIISAGGDTAVTKVKYQLDASGTATTVTLPSAGGQTTVTLTSASAAQPTLLAAGIDTAGNASPLASAALTFSEAPALTGKVTDALTGAALSGVTVLLTPGDVTTTTSATGAYSFTGMNAGTYTVTAADGGVGCAGRIATTEVEVNDAVTIDLNLAQASDVYGYTCSVTPNTAFVSGTTKLALGGWRHDSDETSLPFSIPYYGRTYDKFWATSDGVLEFVDPNDQPLFSPVSLPDRLDAPRGAVAPFWADLYIDGGESVWTATIGTGSDQRFVVEWRNFGIVASTARATFEAILSPDGTITFNYSGVSNDYNKGSVAAVGITSPGGNLALQYSYQSASLSSGAAITFAYPSFPQPIDYGVLSGTVSRDGAVLPGASVRLDNRYVTTDASGRYQFGDVEPGDYALESFSGCDGNRQSDVAASGDTIVDLSLSHFVDSFGYYCDLQDAAWIPADTLVPDTWGTVDFPFSFRYYGHDYTSGEVGPDGLHLNPAGVDYWGVVEIWPGVNLDPDDEAGVYTTTVGSAPNRQFVLEIRNMKSLEYPDQRATFEMIFGEDGTAKVFFKTPPVPGSSPYRNTMIWWQSDESGSTTYFDDAEGFITGKALVLHPPATS